MYKFFKTVFVLLITIPLITGCPPPPPEPEYRLNISIEPENSGDVTITPDKPEHKEDSKVKIEAIPSSEDWQFKDWSGDISTSDNPYTITMNKSYNITANFTTEPVPTFSAEIPITDGVHSQTVTLVSDDDVSAQNDLDSNDREGPPIAPSGAFFIGSILDGMHLYKDVRQASNNIVWELRLHRAPGEIITLEDWSISETDIGGNLILVDDPDDPTPNIEIDMQSTSSFSVSDPSIQSLYVVYSAAPAKVMMNMNNQGLDQDIEVKSASPVDISKETNHGVNSQNQFKHNNY